MKHLLLLEDSTFDVKKLTGEAVYKDVSGNPRRSRLITSEEAEVGSGYKVLNPLQSLFFKYYRGGNSLISAPTSAGKSLIAYLFMREGEGRKVYTAPTRALVYEKTVELSRLFNRKVDMRTGDAIEVFKNVRSDVVVSTYENLALSLRNEVPWTKDIECVVIDEIHHLMSSRGWIVEEIVTALLKKGVRILGLSATLPGALELAKWIRADLFIESRWRPVPLKRIIIPLTEFREPFKTRDSDERIAGKLFTALYELKERDEQVILFVHKKSVGWKILEIALKEKIGILNRTLPFDAEFDGEPEIAFHNADIPREEREEIEREFRRGNLPVLVATHTLAYGVNLPADRVIIGVRAFFDRKEGEMKAFPENVDILQMEGRAGRLGIKEIGYSVILPYGANARTIEREIDNALEGEMVPYVKKKLTKGDLSQDLEKILSLFVLIGFLYEGKNFREFLKRTYSLKEYAEDFYIDEVEEWLHERGYIAEGALSDKALFCVRSGMNPVDYEEFLRRRTLGSEKAVLVRPLLFVKRFEGLYDFVKGGESFIEDDLYVRNKLAPFGPECIADNTHQFLFYIEGLTFKYRNINSPPGEFSYLGTDSLHLMRTLLDIRGFGDLSWSDSEILATAHMVKYGLTEEFSALGGIKGIGHIRSNLLKRLIVEERIPPPGLGEKVDSFYERLKDHTEGRLEEKLTAILLEERYVDDPQRAQAEAKQVVKRIRGSLGGYLVDDRILRVFALFREGPQAMRLSKEELVSKYLGG